MSDGKGGSTLEEEVERGLDLSLGVGVEGGGGFVPEKRERKMGKGQTRRRTAKSEEGRDVQQQDGRAVG